MLCVIYDRFGCGSGKNNSSSSSSRSSSKEIQEVASSDCKLQATATPTSELALMQLPFVNAPLKLERHVMPVVHKNLWRIRTDTEVMIG